MIKSVLLRLGVLNAVIAGFLLFPLGVNAYQPFGVCVEEDAANSSTTCAEKNNSTGDPLTGDGGMLNDIANIVALVAGAAAVLVIILGALKLVTSNGDANSVTAGRKMIVGSLIGLVIIVLARFMIYFVLTKVST